MLSQLEIGLATGAMAFFLRMDSAIGLTRAPGAMAQPLRMDSAIGLTRAPGAMATKAVTPVAVAPRRIT